jgi:hypothetical protein
VGWLDRFPGRKPAGNPQTLARVTAGGNVEADGETWSDSDQRGWRSVEAWSSGFVGVPVGRFWSVDRIVGATGGRR